MIPNQSLKSEGGKKLLKLTLKSVGKPVCLLLKLFPVIMKHVF